MMAIALTALGIYALVGLFYLTLHSWFEDSIACKAFESIFICALAILLWPLVLIDAFRGRKS